jgi:hypothetical protein
MFSSAGAHAAGFSGENSLGVRLARKKDFQTVRPLCFWITNDMSRSSMHTNRSTPGDDVNEEKAISPSAAAAAPWLWRGNARGAAALGVLSFLVFLAGWNVPPPVVNAEARCVAINRAMYATGDLLIPRLHGKMHLTKPPLFHWLTYGVSCLNGGESLASVRLVSALASTALVLLTYFLALQLYDVRTAWWAGLLLTTTLGLLNHGHRGTFDALLAAFVCLTMLGYVIRQRTGRGAGAGLMILGLVGGFLTKGFMGWPAPLLPLTADWLLRTRGRRHAWLRLAAFVPVVLAASLFWYVYLLLRVPEARDILRDVITVNFGVRHTGAHMAFHSEPFWFYAKETPLFFLPWTLILFPLLWCYRRPWSAYWHSPDRLPLLWLFTNIVFLSFIPAKAGRYLVPMTPAFALLAGNLLNYADGVDRLNKRFWRTWLSGLLLLFGVAGLTVFPVWLWVRPGAPVAICLLAGFFLTGGFTVAMYFQWHGQSASAIRVTALLFALVFLFAYATWIPRHNQLRRLRHQHQAPARKQYEQRKERLKQLFRFGDAAKPGKTSVPKSHGA